MKPSRAAWFLFPILGSLLAYGFRMSETDWKSVSPPERRRIQRKHLPLPDGSVLRFLGVPDEAGKVAFWLAERELSRSEARALGVEPGGAGLAAAVSFAEARAICARLSELTGTRARLPTHVEWKQAARGGVASAEAAWGFGLESPPRHLHVARHHAPRKPGPRMGFGFRDLAGGLWEWTQEGYAVGSAWSEQNLQTLSLTYSIVLPENYRDGDVGMRVLIEPPAPQSGFTELPRWRRFTPREGHPPSVFLSRTACPVRQAERLWRLP